MLALDVVLDDIINRKGLKKHFDEIRTRAKSFRDHVKLDLFPKNPSPSLSCLKVPEFLSANDIKKSVADKGYVIMGGQDQLGDRVLRVGHMGEMTHEDLIKTASLINRFV